MMKIAPRCPKKENEFHISGFHIPGWLIDSPGRYVDVICRIKKNTLTAAVQNAGEEDVDRLYLINFLKENKIIKKSDDWEFERMGVPPGKSKEVILIFKKF